MTSLLEYPLGILPCYEDNSAIYQYGKEVKLKYKQHLISYSVFNASKHNELLLCLVFL